MNITQQMVWRLTLLFSAILFIGVIGYSTRSLMRAMHGTDQTEDAAPVSASRFAIPVPAHQAPTMAPAAPGSREAMPAEAAAPTVKAAPAASNGTSGISREFDIMRQREEAHREMIKTLRKQAEEYPDAENTPLKEQIDKLEKSGASIM